MTDGNEEPIDTETTEIVGDDPNPLQKLIEGFCSPQKIRPIPTFDEDDAVNKFEPDLGAQTPSKPVAEPAPTTPTTEDAAEPESEPETEPEIDVSKKVIANRRKRGIETFVMALIFVLGTLLSLKKLGYTTSDLGLKMVDKSSVDSPVVEAEPIVEEPPETEEVEEEL